MLSISSMKAKSAPGVDGICSEVFKCTANIVSKYLVCFFNEIFECGLFPDSWSKNIISPIHKKGSMYDPNHYRAIALSNSISKIFINILSQRLNTWCDDNDILDESQAGFRKGYSTIDNLFNFQSIIQKYLTVKKGRVYVFYFDFRKAFDSCPHHLLWSCLWRNGVNGKVLTIFQSMYEKLKYCVKVQCVTGFDGHSQQHGGVNDFLTATSEPSRAVRRLRKSLQSTSMTLLST